MNKPFLSAGSKPGLIVLPGQFTIHRFPANAAVPDQLEHSLFYSVTRTAEEVSVVCSSSFRLNSHQSEDGWRCLMVEGPLDFAVTGLLAGLASVLAQAGVSIFAISTFDTDYILVKDAGLDTALTALVAAGYDIR